MEPPGLVEASTVVLTIESACDGACCNGYHVIPTLIAYDDGTVLLPDPCGDDVRAGSVDLMWLRASAVTYFDSVEGQTRILPVDGSSGSTGSSGSAGVNGDTVLAVADGGTEILTYFAESGERQMSKAHALGTEDRYPQFFAADQIQARHALQAELDSIRAALLHVADWRPAKVTIRKLDAAEVFWDPFDDWPAEASARVQKFLSDPDSSCLSTDDPAIISLLASADHHRPARSLWSVAEVPVALELLPVLPGFTSC